MPSSVAVSAPGKVLLAGGYLVLDRGYTGLVFGLDARIHVHVQNLPAGKNQGLFWITVKSPQFVGADWRYECYQTKGNGAIAVNQMRGHPALESSNKFVETALTYSLTYVSAFIQSNIPPAFITILADKDYYSSTGSSSSEVLSTKQRFLDFKVPLHEAHKTGLGSSAALVTALTAALLAFYLPANILSLDSEIGKARVHNLAQAAHCSAQGKVGSGFDVAAAVYGSCIYRRFSPSVLENLPEVGTKDFPMRLRSVIENTDEANCWDMEIGKSRAVIPAGLRLIMCDVDCGSETVGMVKKVLAWRKDNPEEAQLLWRTLQKGNEDLADELRRLAQVPIVSSNDLEHLRNIFLTIRSLIRELSTKAGVPIEPKVQTELLDTCCRVSGVVGGVVPGAGGFDAISLLVEDKEEVFEALGTIFDKYKVNFQHGHETSLGQVRLLGVQQEMEGVKVEDVAMYDNWTR